MPLPGTCMMRRLMNPKHDDLKQYEVLMVIVVAHRGA